MPAWFMACCKTVHFVWSLHELVSQPCFKQVAGLMFADAYDAAPRERSGCCLWQCCLFLLAGTSSSSACTSSSGTAAGGETSRSISVTISQREVRPKTCHFWSNSENNCTKQVDEQTNGCLTLRTVGLRYRHQPRDLHARHSHAVSLALPKQCVKSLLAIRWAQLKCGLTCSGAAEGGWEVNVARRSTLRASADCLENAACRHSFPASHAKHVHLPKQQTYNMSYSQQKFSTGLFDCCKDW